MNLNLDTIKPCRCFNDFEVHSDKVYLLYVNRDRKVIGRSLISYQDIKTVLQSGHVWRIHKQGSCKQTRVFASISEAGKHRTINFPRYLLNAPDGLVVDHINHDPLDNRRENLRVVTSSENARNRKP